MPLSRIVCTNRDAAVTEEYITVDALYEPDVGAGGLVGSISSRSTGCLCERSEIGVLKSVRIVVGWVVSTGSLFYLILSRNGIMIEHKQESVVHERHALLFTS